MNLDLVAKKENTMSSREIAEMYGKPHYDVLKKIRRLESAYIKAFGDEGKFSSTSYTDSQNREKPEIRLNKSQALFVASRFDAVLHATVQKRWEDVESGARIPSHFKIPKNYPDALRFAANLQEKNTELMEQIAEDRPKIIFADAVDASKTSILIGDLAKLLRQNCVEIGQNRLFDWLRNFGWLMKGGESRNLPTQKSMERGFFEVKERTVNNPDGSIRVTKTTKVTGKGQQYFINLFLDKDAA